MAGNKDEHRMIFDIRGRRRHVVKFVYAILAVLMAASLFLVVGPVNIGEIFGNSGSANSEAAKQFEEQAERVEAKLKKQPEDPALLLNLTRARVNAGNSAVTVGPNGERALSLEAVQQYQRASESWSDYLEATEEPSAGGAQLMAVSLLTLAESSRTLPESRANLKAAVNAQKIVAEQRPTLNSLSTLALYTLYTGSYAEAEKYVGEAKKYANTKFERENLENQFEETKKQAQEYQQRLKAAEKAASKESEAAADPESLENPLGGGLGGGGGLAE